MVIFKTQSPTKKTSQGKFMPYIGLTYTLPSVSGPHRATERSTSSLMAVIIAGKPTPCGHAARQCPSPTLLQDQEGPCPLFLSPQHVNPPTPRASRPLHNIGHLATLVLFSIYVFPIPLSRFSPSFLLDVRLETTLSCHVPATRDMFL